MLRLTIKRSCSRTPLHATSLAMHAVRKYCSSPKPRNYQQAPGQQPAWQPCNQAGAAKARLHRTCNCPPKLLRGAQRARTRLSLLSSYFATPPCVQTYRACAYDPTAASASGDASVQTHMRMRPPCSARSPLRRKHREYSHALLASVRAYVRIASTMQLAKSQRLILLKAPLSIESAPMHCWQVS